MIDNFSILLSHALLLVMMWRLLSRDDVDAERPARDLREEASRESGANGHEADRQGDWKAPRVRTDGGFGRDA